MYHKVHQYLFLGPLLFILYINDILSAIPPDTILSYADDTAVIATGVNWDDAQNNMNNFLRVISEWLAVNRLSLNVDKTVCMTFGSYVDSVPAQTCIKIHDKIITRVENFKYLGIVFDYNSKWDSHIQYLVKKTKYLVYIFYKISKSMSTETLRMIYYAFFQGIVSYGIIVWGGAYRNNRDLLQKIQKKILRIVNKNNFVVRDNPLNLEQLFSFEALRLHYHDLKRQFLKSESITRNKSINIPKNNKRISDKNSYKKAIVIYNQLPNELKILNIDKTSQSAIIKEWIKSNC